MEIEDPISVDLSLENSTIATSSSYVASFTTGDNIEGTAIIRSRANVRFDEVDLFFLGDERVGARHDDAYRQLLNICHSVKGDLLPTPKVFIEGRKYQLKFAFSVPDKLPSHACNHNTASQVVRNTHLHLPPSFGDPMVAGYGGKLRDDYAPATCRISYALMIIIRRHHPVSGKMDPIFTKKLRIRIKPATLNQTHLTGQRSFDSGYFPLREDIAVRTSRSKTVIGGLSMFIDDSLTFWLPLRDAGSFVNGAIRIRALFRISEASQALPDFESVGGYIVSTTFIEACGHGEFPRKKTTSFGRALNFQETKFPAFSHSFSSLDWTKVEDDCYAAVLLVPVTLPRQNFITTFYSCFISREYTLQLKVKLQSGSSLRFEVPIHIFARQDPSHLPSYDAAVTLGA